MSKQRYVQDSFWTDPYIENLDPSEKLLFLYFLTNPLCNVAGIYEIRNNRIAYETGFDKEMVDRIKQRFIKDNKMIVIDNWIIITNFIKNQSNNPSVLAGAQRIIDALPDNVLDGMTGCIQAGGSLSYFTLLNLTLPYSTLRKNMLSNGLASAKREESRVEEKSIEAETSSAIPELIKLFEEINPSSGKFYSNKTQRAACDRLLKKYQFEQLKKLIEIIPKTNQTKYAPTITSPLQLEDKMAQLISFIKKEQTANIIL